MRTRGVAFIAIMIVATGAVSLALDAGERRAPPAQEDAEALAPATRGDLRRLERGLADLEVKVDTLLARSDVGDRGDIVAGGDLDRALRDIKRSLNSLERDMRDVEREVRRVSR